MKIFLFVFVYLIAFSCLGQGNYTTFFVEANNVNVREFPSSKSKSLGKIPERTTVTWLDSVQATNEIINWNGKDIKGKWYKISAYINNNGIEGWIFEKAFNFDKRVQHFSFKENEEKDIDFSKNFENELIKVQSSSRNEFDKLKPSNYKISNTKKFQKDSILSLPLMNGKKYFVYENINTDDDGWLKISFCGDIKALNLYAVDLGFYEWSFFEFIKKEDGLVIIINDFSELNMVEERSTIELNFSPNNEIIVLGREDGYEQSGICFVDLKNNKSIAIGCDDPKEFRWIDSKSGIAFLKESDYKGSYRESYMKFTIK